MIWAELSSEIGLTLLWADLSLGRVVRSSYKGSFFPQTVKDWNAFPDLIITSASAEGAEDGVARFTSLVRAMD